MYLTKENDRKMIICDDTKQTKTSSMQWGKIPAKCCNIFRYDMGSKSCCFNVVNRTTVGPLNSWEFRESTPP